MFYNYFYNIPVEVGDILLKGCWTISIITEINSLSNYLNKYFTFITSLTDQKLIILYL